MSVANQKILTGIIKESPADDRQLLHLKKKFSGQQGLPPVTNATLIAAYRQLSFARQKKYSTVFNLLTKRRTRTLSGVTPLTVLTKPFKCPGRCIYCPGEPGMPQSYLSNEPAAQRAKINKFDPVKQTVMRIKALEANGHLVDKIELLILGGCFNAYTKQYQESFIKKCFDVCNSPLAAGGAFNLRYSKNLQGAFKKNEVSRYHIIGVTVETRPDLINEKTILWFRRLGITRVQLGVQHLDDKILQYVQRGHSTRQTIRATALLKQAGFKIDYHIMPNLPGATPAKDLKMFQCLFADENFQPDQIKIYPTIVNEYAPLYQWFKQGKYQPYSENQLRDLLIKMKLATPNYVRINRLIRDIPKESISAGNKITNLRELLQTELKKQGKKCKCIRCREARQDADDLKQAGLFTKKYRASFGTEYFISFESQSHDKLYSFIRLRFNDLAKIDDNFIPELKGAALVRELHTYGQLVPVNGRSRKSKIQHAGFGKRLMKIAEELTKKQGLNKIAVIAGIGVRPYYRKLGYRLKGTYMVKYLP